MKFVYIPDKATSRSKTGVEPSLVLALRLPCCLTTWFPHRPEPPLHHGVGLDGPWHPSSSHVLSSVTIYLTVGGLASGHSSVLWAGDITYVFFPPALLMELDNHADQQGRAVKMRLAGKKMLLCKRDIFNVIQNYEPQIHSMILRVEIASAITQRHCWVIGSGERPLTTLQDSLKSVLDY